MKNQMRYIAPLLLLLSFVSSGTAQESEPAQPKVEEGTIVLISGESRSNDCSRKCIRISNVGVQFDDCYDEDSEVFEKDCEAALNAKELYTTLLNTSPEAWEKLEEEIDENHDINAGLPFIVTLLSNGEKKSFILLGIDSFQNKENEVLMKQLNGLFGEWKDCKH